MEHEENSSLKVEFRNSGEKILVPLTSLSGKLTEFLEFYGEASIVGKKFSGIIGNGDGPQIFRNLLKACGYEENSKGFFTVIVQILEKANSRNPGSIVINQVALPYLLILSLLEVLIPGNKFIAVKNVKQLQKLTNIRLGEREKERLQKVLNMYPVHFSMHTMRQKRISQPVAYQYMPFEDELNDEGHTHTWVGQFHRGIIEQMYQNRIIFLLNMGCPVYCRFCFRKHKECRNQKSPTQTHVKNAAEYVRTSPSIKEIVLTGGDPFMNRATLTMAIDLLKEIPHVQSLRIATRSISYYPHLFYANDGFWLNYLKRKQLELEAKGKRIEVATHFIHPDEISIDSLDVITELTSHGICVYVQTPLLKECNDSGTELTELYRKLRGAGAEMHYIYIPCSPIKGNRSYVTPISTGIQLAASLRANLSDRAMPRICTATKIGKIDWNSSGWAVERNEKDRRYIWIRTPYTEDYLRQFAPILQLSEFARVNSEGTLDVRFMADIGDDSLFWGARETAFAGLPGTAEPEPPEFALQTSGDLPRLQQESLADQRLRHTVFSTGSKTLFRPHKTWVEFDLEAENEELKQNIQYIKRHEAITDILFTARNDVTASLHKMEKILKKLQEVHHVTACRLRSLKFNYQPEAFSRTVINMLGKMNQLVIVNPRRLEIETQFLHAAEIKKVHGQLATQLRKKGITVYNNTPLLPAVNAGREDIREIAYKCRENGIEFHHLFVAGLPIQIKREKEHPVDISTVMDIATYLRRYESGREIPRYIIRTSLGDVDFGLTSRIHNTDAEGIVYLSLTPFRFKYYTEIQRDFEWPKGVDFDENKHPVVKVPGLKSVPEFLPV